jgi:hypothetical protein
LTAPATPQLRLPDVRLRDEPLPLPLPLRSRLDEPDDGRALDFEPFPDFDSLESLREAGRDELDCDADCACRWKRLVRERWLSSSRSSSFSSYSSSSESESESSS